MAYILVATPSYGDVVTTNCVNSLIMLKERLVRNQPTIESDVFFFSHASVTYARNVFASRMLEHPYYTHLLMVDSDTGFHPDLIINMLALDKPICGTLYPKRLLDLQRLMTSAREMPEDTPEQRKRALAMSYEYVGEPDLLFAGEGNERRLDIQNGFVRANAAGTGVMLVKREVIEQMLQRFPELVGPTVPGGATTLTKMFFQPFNEYLFMGHTLSEDLSFCRRWTHDLQGELWVQIAMEISHHGNMVHSATYMDKLMRIATRTDLRTG